MIIVGELINASRKPVAAPLEAGDREAVARLARDQIAAGADYVDVNAGLFEDREAELLCWLVEVVQAAVQAPCSLDSPNPEAIEAALSVHRGTPMINSISLEKDRWELLLPLLRGTGARVVALCMSDEGMPRTCDQRLAIAERLVEGLTGAGIPLENIYLDPLVQPVSTNTACGLELLEAVEGIMKRWPGVHTLCGMSNISFGLPGRKRINETFLVMAVSRGLDGAILDPLDRRTAAALATAEMLAGRDDFCARYLEAFRAGLLADR
ncbi:MAG: dihydropteroate synthase [Deltaproteobacteria bacterium]|nr:dihydropteroate synthase [Deltaproteobacteria bacterium]